MKTAGQLDSFIVINGPEDGTEFFITRTSFQIGGDPSCAVNVRLDTAVCPENALATAVSDGYRIRRTDKTPVYVDGKRAGMFRSRIVRSGGAVQVGNTLLTLECSPDGVARRSHGIVSESDFGWVVQRVFRGVFKGAAGLVKALFRTVGRLLSSWLALGAIAVLLYLFWPWFRFHANYLFSFVYYTVFRFVTNLLNQ